MIKRRFYKVEHGDGDDGSSDSSSSSASDPEVEAEATEESDDDDAVAEPQENHQLEASTSSGYESEDSSEIDPNASDSINEDEETGVDRGIRFDRVVSSKDGSRVLEKELNAVADDESAPADMPDCVLKCKSVFRCRICPRIICLNEETMRTHLNSKRHARSEKLLKENRLKAALNSDGEIENQETAAEMNARIIALAQEKAKPKNKGRQRQKKRLRKKKEGNPPSMEKPKGSSKSPAKRRREK